LAVPFLKALAFDMMVLKFCGGSFDYSVYGSVVNPDPEISQPNPDPVPDPDPALIVF
jgi:hypothetical protein